MNVKVRPARPTDKAQLMSFIKDIWEGHDYIPRIWDEWLKDKSGRMFVVEADGVPVGMNRVRFLDDGSAWFEGARVHPEFRGRGMASLLGENSMRVARERGVRIFRLTSGSRNRVAHRQIDRMSFKESSRISVYEPKKGAKFAPENGVKLAGVGDTQRVTKLITESRDFRLGSGVFWDAFAAISLSPSIISKLVHAGSVWVLGESVAVAMLGGEGGETWRQVCFIAGKGEEPARLVRHVFGLKNRKRATRRIIYLPQGSRVISTLRKEGFRRLASLILFERPAVNG
jgi:GNAT superfamily N-acetyltransferase